MAGGRGTLPRARGAICEAGLACLLTTFVQAYSKSIAAVGDPAVSPHSADRCMPIPDTARTSFIPTNLSSERRTLTNRSCDSVKSIKKY